MKRDLEETAWACQAPPSSSARPWPGVEHLDRRTFLGRLAAGAAAATLPAACGSDGDAPAPRSFRPPRGHVYLIAGQSGRDLGGMPDLGLVDGYLDHVPVPPAGFTLYEGLPVDPDEPVDLGNRRLAERYLDGPLAGAILHLSLNWSGESLQGQPERGGRDKAVLEGRFDDYLDELADWCTARRRPILFRPGYEFNRPGPFAIYTGATYAPTFRYVVDRMRARGLEGVEFVWASANLGLVFGDGWDFDRWYPGDDYVDWFGFSQWFPADSDTKMLEEARKRDKPVLLAETSPVAYHVANRTHHPLLLGSRPVTDEELWQGWWQPMLDFVVANSDVVAGWHYIATDWTADPLWKDNILFRNSDARLWASPDLLARWTEMARGASFVLPRADLVP